MNTSKGLLVAYRDHTPKDIRDIAVLRLENGKWSTSKILYPDKWEINACPVNAASAAAKDNHVAIAWYTEADDSPRVQVVFSRMRGATFSKPTKVNTGDTLGYASTALNSDGGAFVSWIEEGESSPALRSAWYRPQVLPDRCSRSPKRRGRAWDIPRLFAREAKPGSRGAIAKAASKRPS